MPKLTNENLRPHQKTILAKIHKSCANDDYLLVYGGKGTFKTSTIILGLWLRLIHLAKYYYDLKYVVGAMTVKQLREVFVDSWREQVPAGTYRINENKGVITLDSGPEIWLAHTSDAQSGRAATKESKKKRGSNISGFYFPQAESVSQKFFDEVDSRVRGEPTRKPGFDHYPPYELRLLDANPDAPEHWIYSRFLDVKSPVYIGETAEVMELRTTAENSAYSAKDIAKFRRTWDESEVARMLDAQWVGASGLVYKNFRRDKHVKKFDPNPNWTWFLGIDFGFNAPFCALWIAIDGDGTQYIFDEVYERELDIYDAGAAIYHKHPDLDIKVAIVDPEEPNAALTLQRYYKDQGSKLRVMKAKKGPGSVRQGIRDCTAALALDSREQPQTIVHPQCRNFRNEITRWEWEKRFDGDTGKIKEIPQENGQDHALDAWRYVENHIKVLIKKIRKN